MKAITILQPFASVIAADSCGIGDLTDGVDDDGLHRERRECIMYGGLEI